MLTQRCVAFVLCECELTAMEKAMNSMEKLHPNDEDHRFGETRITAWRHCGKRLLGFGAASAIHHHEYHSGSIVSDVDDDVVKQMTHEAAL